MIHRPTRGFLPRAIAIGAIGIATLLGAPGVSAQMGGHDQATPPSACEALATGTPMAAGNGHGDHGDMQADVAEVEFDQLYIDMMVPHHEAIIALAEAALPSLTDPRLEAMAEDIIAAQSDENELLLQWRTEWYGSGEPATDEASMNAMLEAMPVGTMDEMMQMMDPGQLVATFCAADNPDLAFVQLTIPHHQMAVDASAIAIEQAVHPELAAYAEEVITLQQAEIDLLNEILAEIEAAGTPVS